MKMFKDIFLIKSDSEYGLDHFLNNIHFGGIKRIFRKCAQLIIKSSQLIFEKWMYLFNHNIDQIWTLLATQKLYAPSQSSP